jgi:glycosyltransferase involved in cell wall biosynthesis
VSDVLRGKVSVIVPAFNESSHIDRSLGIILRSIAKFAPNNEVIVVDDGSHDDTWRKAAAEVQRCGSANVRILRYERNLGKGHALACGTRNATGEFIVFIDADLDLHPDQIPRFFERMFSSHADAVIGSKWHPLSDVDYPRWRRLLSLSYYGLVRSLFDLPVRDTQTGLKLFRAAPLKFAVECLLVKKFAFDIELLAVMHRFGNRIVEAPVRLQFARDVPRLNWADGWYAFVDTMAIFYRMYVLRYYDRERRAALVFETPDAEIGLDVLDTPIAAAAFEP